MDNLITVFMNYKVNRLVEYGVVAFQKDTPFIRDVFLSYFQTYVDNYYYGIFNTIDENVYNRKNLKLEFSGVMEEMLYDYKSYASQMSAEEYQENQQIICALMNIAYELTKIDTLTFESKENVEEVIHSFIENNSVFRSFTTRQEEKLIRLVRDTYLLETKLLQYENDSFTFEEKHFIDKPDYVWFDLIPNIKSLEVYRKGLVRQVNLDEKIALEKMEYFVQKVSHMILLDTIQHKSIRKMFIPFTEGLIVKGKIQDRIYSLMDNPLFKKNTVLAVSFNTYLNHKSAFLEDFHFACVQDFSHINDIYMKIDSIYNEGFSHYLIISDYKAEDHDYLLKYKNEVMSILLFEEE